MTTRRTPHHRAAPDTLAPKERWQDAGLCGAPGNEAYQTLFFAPAHDRDAVRAAKSLCRFCPVLQQCRQWGLDQHEHYGVWGGLDERERRSIWRRQSRDRTAQRKAAA